MGSSLPRTEAVAPGASDPLGKGYDVILVLPYVFSDHPSFPEGILRQVLQAEGFSVGVIARPSWQTKEAFAVLGRPRLFFAIVTGPVDSLVLNYTAGRRRRQEDLYQYGGRAFFDDAPRTVAGKIRPDRALILFANRIREAFREVRIVVGGIEATQRLFAHYDFLEDRIRRSILLDSRADLAVCGMGEKQIVGIANRAAQGRWEEARRLPGIAWVSSQVPAAGEWLTLPSLEAIQGDPVALLEAQLLLEEATGRNRGVVQGQGGRWVVREPPQRYTQEDLDRVYGLPYERRHLDVRGPATPALLMNLFSVTSHRGCGGGCSFCAVSGLQGKGIVSRSLDAILGEVHTLRRHPKWKGIVSDIGGPSADMYGMDCVREACTRPSCLWPGACPRTGSLTPYRDLLEACRKVPGVERVLLGSAIRYDLFLEAPSFLEEILCHHAGRFLRIAPEHTESHVLALMRKPGFPALEAFVRLFRRMGRTIRRPVALHPYLIVGHPGETQEDVEAMRRKLDTLGLPRQDVQIFTPTPGTLSTAMYVSGCGPDLKPIPVERRLRALYERKVLLTGAPPPRKGPRGGPRKGVFP